MHYNGTENYFQDVISGVTARTISMLRVTRQPALRQKLDRLYSSDFLFVFDNSLVDTPDVRKNVVRVTHHSNL